MPNYAIHMSMPQEVAGLIEEAASHLQENNVADSMRSDASEKDRAVHGLIRC